MGGVGWFIWYLVNIPPIPEEDIVSKNGIHWHPKLSITDKGVPRVIPAGIGLGVVHQQMHTHETDGTIHMEFSGLVRKEDTKLAKFFEIWGEELDKNDLKMLVNGKEAPEFGDYLMKDKDRVELTYNN